LIEGAFVVNGAAMQSLTDAGFTMPINIDADLFSTNLLRQL